MPRIVDHDARRAELLDGAFELFAERGYGALTMRGIARELGVSTGTLYHYFDGKVAMARAMYERRVGRDVAQARAAIPSDGPFPLRLAAVAGFVLDHAHDMQRTLLVGIDFSRQEGDEVRPILVENVAVYRRFVAERLELNPEQTASVLSFVFGMFVQRHLDPDSVDVAGQLGALAKLVQG